MHKRALSVAALTAVAIGSVAVATPALAADADVRINEVQSNSTDGSADFVELTNVGTEPVAIASWTLVDGGTDSVPYALPEGTPALAPGAYAVVEISSGATGFSLGATDSITLSSPNVPVVDAYSWTEHAFTEGRVPDGTGPFVDTEPTPGAANVERVTVEPAPVETGIRVNEVSTDDPVLEDFVELTNVSEANVDVSNWILRDDDPLSTLRIPAGTIIEPGAFLVVETNVTEDGFGLGRADEINVLTADGLGLADSYAWTEHATSEGRVPDGTGAFVDTEITRGAANVSRAIDSPVVINEVESNGDVTDWVEIASTDQVQTIDVSGWTLRDGDPTNDAYTFPAGSEIESGGYLVVDTNGTPDHFGLGGTDRVTLRDESGATIDTFGWAGHADETYGRCPDMTGAFAQTAASTKGLVNDCTVVEEPVFDTVAWPYGQDVRDAVAPDTWGEDMSGLDQSADGTVYAVNNDDGEIFEMAGGDAGSLFTIARSWVPTYPDGSGQPDAEGISVAGDGAILLSTERDNTASNVSRPSILRVELGAAGASTTTHEWNLTPIIAPLVAPSPIGANLGIEAVEWISDADATRLGILEADGTAYDPASYGPHLGGIVAFAVEQTGTVHLAVLEEDGAATLLQTTQPGPALSVVMGLDWAAGGNELWALCDEACDNRLSTFSVVDGLLTWTADVAPPAAMPTAYTNEGLVIQRCDVNPAVVPTVLWISDTAHEGVSLRVAPGADCVAAEPTPEPSSPTPTDPTPSAPAPTDPPVVDEAGDGQGTLPQTGGEAAFGMLALAMLLVAAGAALALRRRA